MMLTVRLTCLALLLLFVLSSSRVDVIAQSNASTIEYTLPDESDPHEGTWLTWPHNYTKGSIYRDQVTPIWVNMTREIVKSEKVHIIIQNAGEKDRVTGILNSNSIPLTNITFHIIGTNDVVLRDMGPVYSNDTSGKLVIVRYGFNGWGSKLPFAADALVPVTIAQQQMVKLVDISSQIVLEGGSLTYDGNGTVIVTKSSTLGANRNPGMTAATFEQIIGRYAGQTRVLWLEGRATVGAKDTQITQFARFANENTIVTPTRTQLEIELGITAADVASLFAAANSVGVPYTFVEIPMTAANIELANTSTLGFKGSYHGYYAFNKGVIVPTFNDTNDAAAIAAIQRLYPDRTVTGVDARYLYATGEMIHSVTMQQPLGAFVPATATTTTSSVEPLAVTSLAALLMLIAAILIASV